MGFGGAGPHHSSTASKGVSVAEPPRIGQDIDGTTTCLQVLAPPAPLSLPAPPLRNISRSLTPRRGVCGGADTPAPPSAPLAASLRGRCRQRPSQREHAGLHPAEPPTIKKMPRASGPFSLDISFQIFWRSCRSVSAIILLVPRPSRPRTKTPCSLRFSYKKTMAR